MGLYDAIKDGVDVVQKAGNIEVMKKLLDAQKEALDLFEENRRLREQIAELTRQQDIATRLRHDGYRYWLNGGMASDRGPYCTTCWDVDRKLVRLTTADSRGTELAGYCAYCVEHRTRPPISGR